jgi:hypothetical protein
VVYISMSISEVLLFIATNSKACAGCVEFVEQNRFPVQVVRLDSEEVRKQVANGPYFQISHVPTLIVTYQDGNTQLFVGSPKIVQWMTMIIKRSRDAAEPERGVTSYTPAGGNMYGPRPNPPRPSYPSEPVRRGYIEDDEPYQEPPGLKREPPRRLVVEEDEPETEVEDLPPRKKKTKTKPPPKNSKKKKKPPVNFEEQDPSQEVEVEYIQEDNPKRPPQPKRPPSKMNSIYNVAKQMEQDRKDSLGYREEDLPRY